MSLPVLSHVNGPNSGACKNQYKQNNKSPLPAAALPRTAVHGSLVIITRLVSQRARRPPGSPGEGGTIKVNLECSESVCVLSVANPVALEEDLPALTDEQVFRPGHSLSNTRDRLALAFHGRAGIELVNDGTDWIKVVATFPVWNGKS